MNEPFTSARTALVRPNPWLVRLAAAPWIAAVIVLLTALATQSFGVLFSLVHLALFGALAAAYLRFRNLYPHDVAGPVRADAAGVSFRGAPLVKRSQIREGFVVPCEGTPPLVRLICRGLWADKEIRVENEAEGRRLLRALGLDASQTVAMFKLPSRAVETTARKVVMGLSLVTVVAVTGSTLLVASFASQLPFTLAVLGLIALPLLAFIFVVLLSRTKLAVGSDGLLISWLGRKRFIPYSDVRAIGRYEANELGQPVWVGIELSLLSHEIIRIPVMHPKAWMGPHLETVLERIREAMGGFHHGDTAWDTSILLRGKLEVPQWIRSLRALGTGANAGHRTAPVTPERLWRVVEDPGAHPAARAGAAVALGTDGSDETRRRLHAAARTTAAPRVRIAIETAALHQEDDLAQALAELDAEEAAGENAARRDQSE
jgi:hypothetical protein